MRRSDRGVIVYLTQAARHSTYGRDSWGSLQRSIAMLFENYNAKQRDDIIFFEQHNSNISSAQRKSVLEMCRPAFARFYELPRWHFRVPPGAEQPIMPRNGTRRQRSRWEQQTRRWLYPRFSAGYRHMIRFFTLGLWDIVTSLGYTYVMRLDEESYLWSPIRYNVFRFMAERQLDYAYRLASWESGNTIQLASGQFHSWIRDFISSRNLSTQVEQSGWLLAPCSRLNGSSKLRAADYSLARCGDGNFPYNNFFVSRVGFWQRRDVQDFLRAVNDSQQIYFERFNDILWHGSALQIFLRSSRVHMFNDFSYEHVTVKLARLGGVAEECIGFGSLALGNVTGAEARPALQRLAELQKKLTLQASRAKANRSYDAICPSFQLPCFTVEPYAAGDHWSMQRTDAALLIGSSVSIEQPDCKRRPAPYYCGREEWPKYANELVMRRSRNLVTREPTPHLARLVSERLANLTTAADFAEARHNTALFLNAEREFFRRDTLNCRWAKGVARFVKRS